jgi:NAD(P)-dependent dehydrogenase (short-subunit alcohol dehydrogenase family)
MRSSNDTYKTNITTGTKGKIAIVTGSSKGIGKAVALAFAKSKGYSGIVVNGRKMEEVQEVADLVKSTGCDSIAIQADMSLKPIGALLAAVIPIIISAIELYNKYIQHIP